jgi:hypothetical protein
MSLNKCIYDFHLLAEGWLSIPPHDEGSAEAAAEASAPAGTVASVRMVEFNSDDKPDIWYKAEILQVLQDHDDAKTLIEKYGLPNAILVNCSAQKEELRAQLLRD